MYLPLFIMLVLMVGIMYHVSFDGGHYVTMHCCHQFYTSSLVVSFCVFCVDDRLVGSMDYHHSHHVQPPPPQPEFLHPSRKKMWREKSAF